MTLLTAQATGMDTRRCACAHTIAISLFVSALVVFLTDLRFVTTFALTRPYGFVRFDLVIPDHAPAAV